MKKINDKNRKNDYLTKIRNEQRVRNRRAQVEMMNEEDRLAYNIKERDRMRLARQKKKE